MHLGEAPYIVAIDAAADYVYRRPPRWRCDADHSKDIDRHGIFSIAMMVFSSIASIRLAAPITPVRKIRIQEGQRLQKGSSDYRALRQADSGDTRKRASQ